MARGATCTCNCARIQAHWCSFTDGTAPVKLARRPKHHHQRSVSRMVWAWPCQTRSDLLCCKNKLKTSSTSHMIALLCNVLGTYASSAGCDTCCHNNDCRAVFTAQSGNSTSGICCGAHPSGQAGCCPWGASCVSCEQEWQCVFSTTVSLEDRCATCAADKPDVCTQARLKKGARRKAHRSRVLLSHNHW